MTDPEIPVRIVIADDHPLIREGLRKLVEVQPPFTVVGEAADGLEAVKQAKALAPDLLLLDRVMPSMNGMEVLRELADVAPAVRTVLLTATIESDDVAKALRLGARGIVLKETATAQIFMCLRTVMNGELWIGRERMGDLVQALRQSERVLREDVRPAARLTARELEVIGALVEGASNKDIARSFDISEQTVKNHLSNIFDKLGVSNRLELALYAVHHRLPVGPTADRAAVPGQAAGRRKLRAKPTK